MKKFIVQFENVKGEWFRSVAVPGIYKSPASARKAIEHRGHPGIDYRIRVYARKTVTATLGTYHTYVSTGMIPYNPKRPSRKAKDMMKFFGLTSLIPKRNAEVT